jgi:hypothetical protein
METVQNVVGLVLFLAIAGAAIFFVVRLDLQQFYESYYLKPGSPIRMGHVQQGLGLFSMEAQVPAELLRPSDRLADFGQRSNTIVSSMVAVGFERTIAREPKLAGCKLESLDDLIQLLAKLEAEPPPA